MNNVISILIDSVMWDCISTNRTKVSTTPFLDSLKFESITASNLYSHAPYTDAATKSLYTGRNCLDDFSFFYRLNSAPDNHFKTFHDNGYETYGIYYPYYTIGSGIKKYIDHTFYSAGFIYKSEWGGLYSYYSEILKDRPLNEDEIRLLKSRIELMFDSWLSFYKDVIDNPQTVFLIDGAIKDVDILQKYEQLSNEYRKFAENAEDYITDLLQEGLSHTLARLDDIDIDTCLDRRQLKNEVYDKYKFLFEKFKKSNFKANVFKNAPSFKRLFYGVSNYFKSRNIDELKFLANYLVCLRDVQKSINKSYKHWQDIPSARKHFRFAADVIGKHQSDKPFYLSLHVLDPHNYVSCFSFDMIQDDIIKEEMLMLERFVDSLGTEYVGSLMYFLAIRYVDFCIEELCNKLKENGVWDNTTILFIADHGSSYSFFPLHGARVNCFDDECYHVPMQIRSPQMIQRNVESYYNSKDVFPTLFDIVGIKKPESYNGHSMLDANYIPPNYVITEYTGPGCPDLLSRQIWFSIRDNNYVIGYKVGIYQDFEEGQLCEVYDLCRDPHACYNVNEKIDRNKIQYLLNPLKQRLKEVKSDTEQFMLKLKYNK